MSPVKTLLSAFMLGAILLPQPAFSQTGQGQSSVNELIKKDTKVGAGEEATVGKAVEVHYTGWLYDPNAPDKKGTKFDSSRDDAPPSHFCWARGASSKAGTGALPA
jgi:FKBP-type peptidyl-prolyl cis-trans isomerase FkpA